MHELALRITPRKQNSVRERLHHRIVTVLRGVTLCGQWTGNDFRRHYFTSKHQESLNRLRGRASP